ncbi:MAG: M3 family metallopeptidase [Alphaproteobacteria bacterium]
MRFSTILSAGLALMLTSACQFGASPPMPPPAAHVETNPFFMDWTAMNAFGSPPFDRIHASDYRPAFDRAIAEHNTEIAAIANNDAPPTFTNTIEALERSGSALTRVSGVFFNLTSSDGTPELQAVQNDVTPILSRHQSEVLLNQALYARIDAIYQQRAHLGLDPEQMRLLERTHLNFVRAGAALSADQRARLTDIGEQLSTLTTKFDQNELADTAAWTLVLHGEADMAGLPQAQRDAALQAGHDTGHEGEYVITLQRSSVEPFLQYSTRRDLREQAFRAWAARGANGNQYDNRALIRQILQLRTERAHLLGYPNNAAYILADSMAETPEHAYALMMQVWTPAVARANADRAEMQRMIDREHGGFQLQPWDWRFYAERVRQARYNVSDEETRPYLVFDNVMAGAFWTANKLFGMTFVERHDIPVYNPDVRAFEVHDRSGQTIGLYFLDPYARPTKQSGAWMNNFREQQRLAGNVLPIVVNCWNFNKPQPGQPTLLSWDDGETVFHEFGHALHSLNSNVTYESLSGTNVARDYVEFPSQVMERWFGTDEVLSQFARRYDTNAPMPADLIARIRAAKNFNQGFAETEYLASAIIDMDLHMQTTVPDDFDVDAFERGVLTRIHMPPQIIPRHRPAHFGHIFGASGGYEAGYYGYIWAEVLAADAYSAFTETGDVFNPAVAQRFQQYIYASGNSRPEMESYRLFRGHDPSVEPLLQWRGFAGSTPAPASPAHSAAPAAH